MATFKPTEVTGLEYNLTTVPKIGGKPGEMCSGEGVIPEPSDEAIDAYLSTDTTDGGDDGAVATFKKIREAWTASIEALGVPKDHLDELPLVAFHEFKDWLADELLPNGSRSAAAR